MADVPLSDVPQAERFAGCLLGGAVGDALGAPVEFLSRVEIEARYGPEGIRDLAEAHGRIGAITDDTQMTLFTGEGLIRAHNRMRAKGICHVPSVVRHAYQRWLHTQGVRPSGERFDPDRFDGWLIGVKDLHARRAPGITSLSALATGELVDTERRVNDSKGCGGLMRVAPVGLLGPRGWSGDVFSDGCEAAALTHGHPSGYLAAGFLASLVAWLREGEELPEAVHRGQERLSTEAGRGECELAVERAVDLAHHDPPSASSVAALGEGWVADEALAIGIYCALGSKDFEEAIALAVNHSGDSDSTGAITGNIMGTALGVDAIPERWLEGLELRDEIERLARDMWRHFGLGDGGEPVDEEDDLVRYPGS